MKASLSVLLPVHNAQSTVGDAIGRLLEILPELTNRFEIIVIDDGSSDATCEVADDWARHYPQVSFFRQAALCGWQAAVLKHAWRARGEYLMLLCGDLVDAAAINTAWGLRDQMSVTGADARAADGRALRIDRRQSDPKGRNPEAASASALARVGIHVPTEAGQVLLVHRFRLAELERALAAASPSARPTDSSEGRAGQSRIKGPNFLSRIKQFALGE
jgi:glycosyltransferase involved in cell wall biosynthesis